jgi:hypothetical protein
MRARVVVRVVVACVVASVGGVGATFTTDGRTCAFPKTLRDGTEVRGCVPYGETGTTWCVAEEDGRWGACGDGRSSAREGVVREEVLRAAATLAKKGAGTSEEEAREARAVLDGASELMLRALALENIELADGTVASPNPVVTYLESRGSKTPPPRASPPMPPPTPPPSVKRRRPRCAARTDVRWESPQSDGSKEFGMDVYVVLVSGDSITGGWRITFAFASDDVVLYPNSAYGADASVIYAPEYGGRAFRLRDRGYDATLERYATKRVGFNVRAKSNASGLRLSFLEINGDACAIMESS